MTPIGRSAVVNMNQSSSHDSVRFSQQMGAPGQRRNPSVVSSQMIDQRSISQNDDIITIRASKINSGAKVSKKYTLPGKLPSLSNSSIAKSVANSN